MKNIYNTFLVFLLGRLLLSWFQTFVMLWMLYSFFWVIPRRLNCMCRRFGIFCLFHLRRLCEQGSLWRWTVFPLSMQGLLNQPPAPQLPFCLQRTSRCVIELKENKQFQVSVKYFFFVQCHHMSLWTSWTSVLGMAALQPTSEDGTPMRHSYVVPMMWVVI